MKKHSVFMGVDVSKNKFDVCVLESETHCVLLQATYENTKKGIGQMQKQLLKEIKKEKKLNTYASGILISDTQALINNL